jgi:hypothetical protein
MFSQGQLRAKSAVSAKTFSNRFPALNELERELWH